MNAIIALNPGQMAEAQSTTMAWIDRKLADAEAEYKEAEGIRGTLSAYGLRVDPAERQLDKAQRRINFYTKVKAALDAGYYIIPPFDIQLFAVRTDRAAPEVQRDEYLHKNREQPARALPIGAGQYRNPTPIVSAIDIETRPGYTDPSKTREVTIYGNTDWRDELDMPLRALKPELIEATGRALELKIFDALGIAPAYRAADPIIAGQIKRPDGKGVLTFFVAWWLDEADL